jgi:hypothetical protein
MKRIKTLFLLLCLAVMNTVWAGPITESQAKSIAANFLANRGLPSSGLKTAHKAPHFGSSSTSDQAAFYVFNSERHNNGFVIVAGDDRAPAVLGYSDHGTFDVTDVPPAMQELLEGYTAQIEELDNGAIAATQLQTYGAITPLVGAAWSQNAPYNILLPYLPSGKHAYAGCVATALAQVMHYWQWPPRPTTAIPAYTSSTLGIVMPELPVVDFNWGAMQNTYQTTDTTSSNALEAAKLTLYCAQAVEMNFKTASSGATTTRIPLCLSSYFGYSDAHTLRRTSYTTQGWVDAIYSELAASRPVIFSGSKAESGHAFVCDGYDGNGMFHINWGWNGQSNGYYLLNVLNPDRQGTGSATGAYGYIYDQAAVVGIEPGNEINDEVMFTVTDMILNSFTGTRNNSSGNFTAIVSAKFYNYTAHVFAADFGWGLYQGSTMVKKLMSVYTSSSTPGKYFDLQERELSFGAGLSNGTYRILPICSERNANNWKPCIGYDKNYIEVTINGNTCTFKGYGTAATPYYTVNGITHSGTMHPTRPVNINVNLTNNGVSDNLLLHMFVDGTFMASGYVGLEPGETGDITYRYYPDAARTYTLTFSFNEDGSDPIASHVINIEEMPAADLSANLEILDVTDATNKIITSDKFSVMLTITNNGSTTYSEDITAKLYKNIYGTTGTNVQIKTQFITLAPGASTTVQFDMDNVIDGWKYFIKTYYYTSGTEEPLKGTSTYTIVFPEIPKLILGDVNDDGNVSISDVTALIDYLLNPNSQDINEDAADVNQDSKISISDVTTLIDMLLTQH